MRKGSEGSAVCSSAVGYVLSLLISFEWLKLDTPEVVQLTTPLYMSYNL
jgi:hypothetical protein